MVENVKVYYFLTFFRSLWVKILRYKLELGCWLFKRIRYICSFDLFLSCSGCVIEGFLLLFLFGSISERLLNDWGRYQTWLKWLFSLLVYLNTLSFQERLSLVRFVSTVAWVFLSHNLNRASLAFETSWFLNMLFNSFHVFYNFIINFSALMSFLWDFWARPSKWSIFRACLSSWRVYLSVSLEHTKSLLFIKSPCWSCSEYLYIFSFLLYFNLSDSLRTKTLLLLVNFLFL